MLRVWLFVVCPVLGIALGVSYWLLHRKIIQRLQNRHAEVWKALSEPTLFDLWWSPFRYGGKQGYFGWLHTGGYKACGDEQLTSLGNRYFDTIVLGCCLLLSWPVLAWYGGYLRLDG